MRAPCATLPSLSSTTLSVLVLRTPVAFPLLETCNHLTAACISKPQQGRQSNFMFTGLFMGLLLAFKLHGWRISTCTLSTMNASSAIF
ncbi:hypothetical protein C2E23DRAFT_828248 [Lenzites betulinus]|nr:hypothetical protein C2E23DRAFT_828248 [Lenzites betulinus]